MSRSLFTYPDGSELIELSSERLRKYEAWVGQRPLSEEHIAAIEENIGGDVTVLNRDYKLVKLRNEESGRVECYIIDGQHRAALLRKYPEANFSVTAIVYDYTENTMDDVNELFRRINYVKPFMFDDETTLDINKLAGMVMMHFNQGLGPKDQVIRQVRTRAPYMCISVITDWLRELAKKYDELPNDKLVMRVLVQANEDMIEKISGSDESRLMRCKEIGFALILTEPKQWTEAYSLAIDAGEY